MNCKQCGEVLKGMREDALFCNGNCKQKHYKRRKKIQNRIKICKRSIESEKDAINYWNESIQQHSNERKEKIDELNGEIQNVKRLLVIFNKRSQYDNNQLYKHLVSVFKNEPKRFREQLKICQYGLKTEKLDLLQQYRKMFASIITQKTDLLNELTSERNDLACHILVPDEFTSGLNQKITKSEKLMDILKSELDSLLEIDLDRLPIIPSRKVMPIKSKKTANAQSYTGREIAEISHDYVQLHGELGRFLGKLERNKCAIALTGDSGAGKSHFSYSLANGFLDQNQTVGYFTLESGFNSKFRTFAKRHSGDPNFRAFEEGTLEDVRTEAKNFDCLIIDSYSKISGKAADFENLRQDFPDTFFIIIFQKTTDGKIRGGSSILFNSTATIDIQINEDGERVAIMVKSRYDTENFVYSVTADSLLKSNKMPLN